MSKSEDGLGWDLVRPIALMQPDRTVYPPSWLEHIPFAFWLIDVLRPRVFVELGTHSGNSYGAFAQAVQHLGLDAAGYAIDTWKGDSQAGFYDESVFTDWKAYHDARYSAFSTLVRSTFDDALEHFADRSIDLLNIDGFHTTEAVMHDFSTWLPKISARGVVLMHDINVRERDFGAWRAWEQIRSQYPSFEFLHGHGLGVLAVGADVPAAIVSLLGAGTDASGRAAAVRQLFAGAGAAILSRYRATMAERASEARAGSTQHASEASVIALRAEIERLTAAATTAATDKGRAEERSVWLQGEIERRGQRLEEIEKARCELERSRAELDRLAHDAQAKLQAAEARAVEANGQAEASARRAASLETERAALADDIREWEQHAAALEADRDRLQRELADTLQVLAARAEEIKVLGEELGIMRGSHSWRLTSPLRGIMRKLRRLNGA